MPAISWPPVRDALNTALLHKLARPSLCVLAALPFLALSVGALTDRLGANPAEALIRDLGEWTLRGLFLTLAVTPARTLLGLTALARFRRMAGLFTFGYACLHLLAYAWFDMGLDLADITQDIAKRPFILVGFLSLLLLTPLAATSFNRAVRALGAPRWQRLHQLVHLTAWLVLLHFFWMRAGKNDFADVAVYTAILLLLQGWRVARWVRGRAMRAAG